MLRLGYKTGEHLNTLDTHLIYSPAIEPFITTDNPFVLTRMVDDDQTPSISATSFIKWIPVSARLAIGFGVPGNQISFTNVEPAKTRKLNVGLAMAAREIVLARSNEQLEEIVSAIPNEIPQTASAFPSVIL